MCNGSSASLVNKSQIMSRAFYKMQESVLSFYAVFLGNNESSYKEKVSSFLTRLIDVISFIFPYFFSSFLYVTGNKIRCIQNITCKEGLHWAFEILFLEIFLKQRDVTLNMPCFCHAKNLTSCILVYEIQNLQPLVAGLGECKLRKGKECMGNSKHCHG